MPRHVDNDPTGSSPTPINAENESDADTDADADTTRTPIGLRHRRGPRRHGRRAGRQPRWHQRRRRKVRHVREHRRRYGQRLGGADGPGRAPRAPSPFLASRSSTSGARSPPGSRARARARSTAAPGPLRGGPRRDGRRAWSPRGAAVGTPCLELCGALSAPGSLARGVRIRAVAAIIGAAGDRGPGSRAHGPSSRAPVEERLDSS